MFRLCVFDTHALFFQSTDSPRQKHTRGLTVGQTRKIHPHISPTPPLNFAMVQKIQNLVSIFDSSRKRLRNGWTYRKPKKMRWIFQLVQRPRAKKFIRDWILGWAGNHDSDISSTPPLIFIERGSKKGENLLQWSITQSWVVRYWSNLVQSFNTWYPMHKKCSRTKGQKSRSQHQNVV